MSRPSSIWDVALLRVASRRDRPMNKHDKALYDAWLEGFDRGWEYGREGYWPVKFTLRHLYWQWRERRRRG